MMIPPAPPRSRLLGRDILRLGAAGVRSRPTRAILSALGIAIGIAAMVAVVGISTSSQARLGEQLAALGTNLLTVTPGQSLDGRPTVLPPEAVDQIRRVEGVQSVSSIAELTELAVYRSEFIDPRNTNGIAVLVADGDLLEVTGSTLRTGSWLHEGTGRFPVVVLGGAAAERLGVTTVGSQITLGGLPFTVLGILDPVVLAPELESAAMIPKQFAAEHFGFTGSASKIYERSTDDTVAQVRALLPATIDPAAPEEVDVSRPSDALAAKYAAADAFAGLLLGLGSVAVLVGGIGVANTMIISVLERRREIGLRRALGATRAHIGQQFLVEAILLSTLGGLTGALLGVAVTAVFTLARGWVFAIPPAAVIGAVIATAIIGGLSGLHPAVRAARTSPTTALNS